LEKAENELLSKLESYHSKLMSEYNKKLTEIHETYIKNRGEITKKLESLFSGLEGFNSEFFLFRVIFLLFFVKEKDTFSTIIKEMFGQNKSINICSFERICKEEQLNKTRLSDCMFKWIRARKEAHAFFTEKYKAAEKTRLETEKFERSKQEQSKTHSVIRRISSLNKETWLFSREERSRIQQKQAETAAQLEEQKEKERLDRLKYAKEVTEKFKLQKEYQSSLELAEKAQKLALEDEAKKINVLEAQRRVRARQEIDRLRDEERKQQDLEEYALEQIKQDRIKAAMNTFSTKVRSKVPRDPQRILKVPSHWENNDLVTHGTVDLFALKGFSEERLMRDVRYKLSAYFHEAGLSCAGNNAARNALLKHAASVQNNVI
jgi:hypothetical protein